MQGSQSLRVRHESKDSAVWSLDTGNTTGTSVRVQRVGFGRCASGIDVTKSDKTLRFQGLSLVLSRAREGNTSFTVGYCNGEFRANHFAEKDRGLSGWGRSHFDDTNSTFETL